MKLLNWKDFHDDQIEVLYFSQNKAAIFQTDDVKLPDSDVLPRINPWAYIKSQKSHSL